jgi:cytochrome P450
MARKHPPGPRNILAPFALTYRHLIQMWRRPLEFVTKLHRTYGPVAFFRVFGVRLYVVSDPKLIHDVLVGHKNKFRKVERQMRTIRQVVGNGILTSGGDFWLRQRRLLQKAFSPKKLEVYAGGMVDQTELLLDSWDARGDGAKVDITLEMMRLTLGIATRAFFGEQPRQRAEILARANKVVSEAFTREMLSVFRLPDWLPLPNKIQKRRALRDYINEVGNLVREKRASPVETDDLLSAVLNAVDEEGDGNGMTNEQALDELLTIYIAGHHTTSVALSWTFYLLAKHPEIEKRILEEVRQVVGQRRIDLSDLPKLQYTEMVIKESLRLYPPAYVLFAREALEDVNLGEHWIKKGGWIYMYPYVVHRDPQNFENPETFDPERFSPQRIDSIPQHAYMPFGLGPHVCIGQHFAMIEFVLAVATILRRYSMQIEPGHENARNLPLLANHIRGGLPVRLHRRARSEQEPTTPTEPALDKVLVNCP